MLTPNFSFLRMNALNQSTRRRLQQLRQIPCVWEGDRRGFTPPMMRNLEMDNARQGDCILWVDATEGIVRAMDMVSTDAGPEAVVRTLLQAMEHPHGAAMPGRPQKIVVRDREIQFFLRGVLQDLGIVIDYVPDLPLIDEIFEGIQGISTNAPPELPDPYVAPVLEVTQQIWELEPWATLDEEKVIAVELKQGDVDTLYLSILGMLGMEYGLLMYRSLDSLKKFRRQVLQSDDNPQTLEEAFLEQDCLFVTFDRLSDLEEPEMLELLDQQQASFAEFRAATGMQPSFGNLHPLEGMRPMLYEEEARTIFLALSALQRFFQQHLAQLDTDHFPALSSRYRITDPVQGNPKVSVKVSTLPEVADELYEMSMEAELEAEEDISLPILHNDLIPEDAFYSLGAMPWETLDVLRAVVQCHQDSGGEPVRSSDGFPVILIQTSRPKAKALIEGLQAAGGLKGICFNPGEDPISGEQYDLGILQMNNGELHLFGEFYEQDPVHIQARKKWDQRCKKTKGFCGLVIARGLKGSSRGNPQLNDMMALFEARSISEQELGLGSLQLMPYLE